MKFNHINTLIDPDIKSKTITESQKMDLKDEVFRQWKTV